MTLMMMVNTECISIPYRLSSSNAADGICDHYPDDVEFRTLFQHVRQKMVENSLIVNPGTSLVEGKNVVNVLNCR